MAASQENSPRPTEAQPRRDMAPAATVLLVDDDESVRKLISRFLTLSGFQVFAAESGPKALPIWREYKERINLLLTDMVMPEGISGLDLATQLRAERPGLQVIFSSGYDTEIVGEDGVLRTGLRFLQKPYRPEQLLATIRVALANKENLAQSIC